MVFVRFFILSYQLCLRKKISITVHVAMDSMDCWTDEITTRMYVTLHVIKYLIITKICYQLCLLNKYKGYQQPIWSIRLLNFARFRLDLSFLLFISKQIKGKLQKSFFLSVDRKVD